MGGLVFDASVLIDFVSHDPHVLQTVAVNIAPVVIPLPVVTEVDGLDQRIAEDLDLTIYESTREQLDEALDRPRTLSFEDYVCFVTARDLGITCVTNDEALIRHCRNNAVPVLRGFRPLLILVQAQVLTPLSSLRIVRAIYERNDYITRSVVITYIKELRVIAASLRSIDDDGG